MLQGRLSQCAVCDVFFGNILPYVNMREGTLAVLVFQYIFHFLIPNLNNVSVRKWITGWLAGWISLSEVTTFLCKVKIKTFGCSCGCCHKLSSYFLFFWSLFMSDCWKYDVQHERCSLAKWKGKTLLLISKIEYIVEEHWTTYEYEMGNELDRESINGIDKWLTI